MATQNEAGITLTPEVLKDMIATAVTAAVAATKAPNVIEQKKLDEEAKIFEEEQRQRKSLSESVLADAKQKREMQRICSHEHKNGDSHCVFVQSGNDRYILCQKNQCKIRPGVAPVNYGGNDIYDSALFNRLFQKLPTNELFQ